jgi:hypothetical protein
VIRCAIFCVAALVALSARPARAADEHPRKVRLAVIASVVHRPEADTELGSFSVQEEASQVVSFSPDLAVVPSSETLARNLDDQIRDCGADIRCVSARLRSADVDLALLIVADLGLRPPIVTTRMLDCKKEAVLETSIAELGAEGLRPVVRAEAAKALERAGHPIGGRIQVETTPADATVIVHGEGKNAQQSVGSLLELAPGAYQISVVRDGYTQTSTHAWVRAGQETRIWLKLEESSGLVASPWFWAAIVAVAAAAGTAIFFALRSDDRRQLCQGCP